MKFKSKKIYCLLLVIIFLNSCQFQPNTKEIPEKVIAVSDGDTFTYLNDSLKQVKVRLHGIDCPESSQAFGQKAKQFTSDFIFGKKVIVEVRDIDRYGRVVGVVTLPSGENLNESLLENGFAWHYKQYDKSKRYSELEEYAKQNRKGLWGDKNPVAPWEFRKNQKNNRTQKKVQENQIIFICNSKNSKSYHLPECYSLSNCKSETVSLGISNAEKKGYKACGRCFEY